MGLYALDFKTLTGDTGYHDASSIAPILNGEPAREDILGRPDETIRVRSDVLRDLLLEQRQLNDLDRSLLLIGGGTLTFTGSAVVDTGTITASAAMYLMGMATPGGGGSPTYLDSTKSFLSIGTPSNNEMTLTSVQDNYQSSNSLTSRVNLISLEIIDGGVAAPLTVVVEGSPAAHIKVTIEAGVHTVQNVISAINANGSANVLVLAALGAGSTSGNASALFSTTQWGSDLTVRFLRGGAAGIAHEITSGGFSSFFATAANRLQKGDTVAIAYDKILNNTTTGGRLQSVPENANINVDGALFNTRRNPEKIPNCLPIAKCIDDNTVVFLNRRYIVKGTPGTFTVDSVSGANAPVDSSTFLRLDIAPCPHIPPATLQQAWNNADVLFNVILVELETARISTTYGSFATLDLRLEAAESEVVTARNSAAYATLYGSLDARLEASESEVITARTTDSLDTPSFAGYASLDARLDRHADHSRVFVSVSDLGGINAMFSNLKLAVDYLNTTLTGGTIHCIDTVAHDVTSSAGTQFPVIVRPIRIIGQDKVTITDNRTGTSTILTFSPGSEGSLLDNVDIVPGGSPSSRALKLNASRVTVRNAIITGEVVIGDGATPTACLVEQTVITVAGAGLIALNVKGGEQHRINSTTVSASGTAAKGFAASVSGVTAIFDQCQAQSDSVSTAVSLEVTTSEIAFNDCRVKVGTLLALGGGGQIPVRFEGVNVSVKNLLVQLTGATSVLNGIVRFSNGVKVHGCVVDGNDRLLNYAGASFQNPVQVFSSADVNDLTVKNFNLPNNSDDGFTLKSDEPIVNIEGTTLALEPTVLRNLRMLGMKTGFTISGVQKRAFVGPRGATTNNTAAISDQNLRLLDAVIVLKSSEISVTDALSAERLILSNFGNYSEIRGCSIMGDAVWNSFVLRVRGATFLRVIDNTVNLTAFQGASATILGFLSTPNSNLQVNDNHIYYVTNGTNGAKAILVDVGTKFTVNNNVIERSGISAAGDSVLNLNNCSNGTDIGNTVITDGTPTDPIDYTGTSVGVVPADTFQGTLNAIV
jgi:hypothetical protein